MFQFNRFLVINESFTIINVFVNNPPKKKVCHFYKKKDFLTNSLKEVVSKLSEEQREEVDVIESIVDINEGNKENTKEKLFWDCLQKHRNCSSL